jgi:hypothetical protein
MEYGSVTEILDQFHTIKMTEAQIAAVCLSVRFRALSTKLTSFLDLERLVLHSQLS